MAKAKWQSKKEDQEFFLPSKNEYKKFINSSYISNSKEEEEQLDKIVGVEKIATAKED